jgi:hypothetical protein
VFIVVVVNVDLLLVRRDGVLGSFLVKGVLWGRHV